MSERTTKEPPSIRLSTAVILDGKYFGIGQPLPFTDASALPENLRPYITAAGDEMLPHPSDRDIYLSPAARRQARALEAEAQRQEWAEELASEPLREDVAAELEAQHAARIGKALAEAQFNQDAIDNLHEAIAAAAEPEPFFVRRGSVYSRVEKVKLKPGEPCFTKAGDGEWRTVGCVDSAGQLPPQEITP
jgi:hypothetical protein